MSERHVILLAKSAIAAQPTAEMARLAELVSVSLNVSATYAFTEHGTPSLSDRLDELASRGATDITLAPAMLPMEPGLKNWLTRAIHRWRTVSGRPFVTVRIGPAPAESAALSDLLLEMTRRGLQAEPVAAVQDKPLGSIVPKHERRVLVCQGGPCNDVGAGSIWLHLRAEQARLGLRDAASMMSARTSCLGPCNLAPVVQVYPEGVYYGGVDQAGIDRIVAEHLMHGLVVNDLAYEPLPNKQRLRAGHG